MRITPVSKERFRLLKLQGYSRSPDQRICASPRASVENTLLNTYCSKCRLTPTCQEHQDVLDKLPQTIAYINPNLIRLRNKTNDKAPDIILCTQLTPTQRTLEELFPDIGLSQAPEIRYLAKRI